jgi:hypothetical protein
MLHAAAAAGGPGMMPASSIAAACQYSCTVQYSTVLQYEDHRSSSAWPARAAAAACDAPAGLLPAYSRNS